MSKIESGSVITFYSYKGGVGRSMALANVAWLLASNGRRVLAVDWDLEAPGLHRFFRPFLDDRHLASCPGLIDLLIDHLDSPPRSIIPSIGAQPVSRRTPEIANYTLSLEWQFPRGGALHLMPAGRPSPAYASRVSSFNWEEFYSSFQGGAFLNNLREEFRRNYDYVLIDSRTGLGDSAGICTVQMPDILVILFVFNFQNMDGSARVAESVETQRRSGSTSRIDDVRIFPIPARVEYGEKSRLDIAREHARSQFSRFLWHVTPSEVDRYWSEIEIPYYPFYSFEETLCAFGDRPNMEKTMLASMECVCTYLTDGMVTRLPVLIESRRVGVLSTFTRESPKASRKPSCFISYSSKDDEFANRLYGDLKDRGFECWFAPHDLSIGAKIRDDIDEAIHSHDKVLLVLSGHAIESEWVGKEVETTFEREVTSGQTFLVPIRLDSAVMSTSKSWAADIRRQRNIGDFSGWTEAKAYREALEKLLVSLMREK